MDKKQLIPQSPPDSWSLCDSCRLLAHALIGPQNHHAQHTLCLMMETHLKALQAALNLPIPEYHQSATLPANDGLFDDVELEPAELCDQCFALNYALLMLSDKWVKEVIAFVLWERLEMLRRSLYVNDEVQA
ncbi:hypothetical protein [Rouxiella sp. Mn2063]|uniref:hypothetical protein n=1 Tax=Rouxiella sp. Mn2063 TaxID=3395262 RepID=UPI003BCA1DA9